MAAEEQIRYLRRLAFCTSLVCFFVCVAGVLAGPAGSAPIFFVGMLLNGAGALLNRPRAVVKKTRLEEWKEKCKRD